MMHYKKIVKEDERLLYSSVSNTLLGSQFTFKNLFFSLKKSPWQVEGETKSLKRSMCAHWSYMHMHTWVIRGSTL